MFRIQIIRKTIALVTLALTTPLLAADLSPVKLLAAGRVDDAIVTLRGRIHATPNDPQSQNLLCRAYLALNDWDSSIAACQKAVQLAPENSEYHLWLGRAYGEKAENSSFIYAISLARKVRSEFETSVRLDPNNAEARSDLADYYVEAPGFLGGGLDKAAAQAQQLNALDPAEAHLTHARIAEKQHDSASAERELRAALEVSGGVPGRWIDLAQFYKRNNRFDQMQDAIRHATSAQDNQRVLAAAAEILIDTQRNLPYAGDLLRRYLASETVEDAPAFKAHYLLGNLLEKEGDTEGAGQEYRNALALARDFTLAQNALKRLGQPADTIRLR